MPAYNQHRIGVPFTEFQEIVDNNTTSSGITSTGSNTSSSYSGNNGNSGVVKHVKILINNSDGG